MVGCVVTSDLPEYSLGFYNDTGTQITDSRADWHADGIAHFDGGGVLSPGADKVSHRDPRPIPSKTTVTWKTVDGKAHIQEVEVAKLVADPPKFSGTIYFKFTADDHVTVIPLNSEKGSFRLCREAR
jgi:hypothetical protein